LGHHRSVAGTTSRRCPSARTRPGAGDLPTSVLGRSRGFALPRGLPARRAFPDRPAAEARAVRVTLLRSAPRPVYRVYSEEEFLAAEDWPSEPEPNRASIGQAIGRREPRRWGRVAAVAALSAFVAAVAGVVAVDKLRSRAGTDRRFAGGGIAPTAPRKYRPTQPLPIDRGSTEAGGHSPSASIPRSTSIPGSTSAPVSGSGDVSRRRRMRPASPTIRRVAERHTVAARLAIAQTRAPSRSHPAATAAISPAVTAATTAATGAAAVAPATTAAATATTEPATASGASSEFGFERR
jgi:hypothetical protein